MNNNLLEILRIGIFYDGYYFYKVSNYYKYEHDRKARISISGLHDFIKNEVAQLTGTDIRQCQIIDAHYFKGRSSAKEMGEKVQSERIFEDILMRENIVSHYLPLRYNENNVAQEKGIDVWLALEAYELAIYKHFDVLVLVAGDGDYVPLVRKLHTQGTQVLLISWDFTSHNESGNIVETKTSRQLQEEVFHFVPMYLRIEQNGGEYIKNLFVPDRNVERVQSPLNFKSDPADPRPPAASEEFSSTIFSINVNGFGFIKDEGQNNLFFHYSTVTNRDFSELQAGMRVRYLREEDPERSKRDGELRYRACRVTVVD
ncbi:MAG: NYN domain-containing protein [Treponema sp.]|nr:NYN domain-containing protein [Treponema sp.]